jgi:hypothetical protein
MNWLKKLFKSKPEPIPEPIREIIHVPYETIVLKSRISDSEMKRYARIDSNYAMTQIQNQLAMELLEQIINQNLIEFKQTQDFGQNIIEAQILVSIKNR